MSLFSLLAPVAGNILGGILGNSSSSKAQKALTQQYQKGADTIGQYYNEGKQYLQPYNQTGLAGNNKLLGLLNDPNSIADTAAYKFRFDQGMNALDNSAASRGGLFGGGHQRELMDFGQGLASQEYGNEWNRLMGLTQFGGNMASNIGQLGAQAGANIANLYGQQGQAMANGAAQRGANYGGMLGSIGSLFGNQDFTDMFGNQNNPPPIIASGGAPRNIGPYS